MEILLKINKNLRKTTILFFKKCLIILHSFVTPIVFYCFNILLLLFLECNISIFYLIAEIRDNSEVFWDLLLLIYISNYVQRHLGQFITGKKTRTRVHQKILNFLSWFFTKHEKILKYKPLKGYRTFLSFYSFNDHLVAETLKFFLYISHTVVFKLISFIIF